MLWLFSVLASIAPVFQRSDTRTPPWTPTIGFATEWFFCFFSNTGRSCTVAKGWGNLRSRGSICLSETLEDKAKPCKTLHKLMAKASNDSFPAPPFETNSLERTGFTLEDCHLVPSQKRLSRGSLQTFLAMSGDVRDWIWDDLHWATALCRHWAIILFQKGNGYRPQIMANCNYPICWLSIERA